MYLVDLIINYLYYIIMSGRMSRNKGQRGEREVAKILTDTLKPVFEELNLEPPLFKRNLSQTQDGGYDLVGLDFLAIEVKFQETFNLNKWWEQTKKQTKEDQIGILIYRKKNIKWRIRMISYFKVGDNDSIPLLSDIDLEDFKLWITTFIKNKLK